MTIAKYLIWLVKMHHHQITLCKEGLKATYFHAKGRIKSSWLNQWFYQLLKGGAVNEALKAKCKYLYNSNAQSSWLAGFESNDISTLHSTAGYFQIFLDHIMIFQRRPAAIFKYIGDLNWNLTGGPTSYQRTRFLAGSLKCLLVNRFQRTSMKNSHDFFFHLYVLLDCVAEDGFV